MKLEKWSRAVIAAVLAFTVVACTSTPTEKLTVPDRTFNAESKYAIVWIKPCHTKFLGGCEPDDGRTTEAKLAIHGAAERVDLKKQYEDDVGLSASIARIDATSILQTRFLKSMRDQLSARQLNVVALANPIYEGALQKRSSSRVIFDDVPLIGATQFPLQVKANTFEFAPMYEKLGVDYLLVMELLRFNVERHFGPTGQAVSNPHAVSAVRLYVHERDSGEIVFNDYAYHVVLAEDDWNRPPHYRSLAKSLTNTLHVAIDEAQANLLRRQKSF